MKKEILTYPNPDLRKVAALVSGEEFGTEELKSLVADMAETMYAAQGAGLAAPQVGVAKRIFVLDCSPRKEPDDLRVFINPEITKFSEAKIREPEGCLSFPGVLEAVTRSERVVGHAYDEDGKKFEFDHGGGTLYSIAIQHESEHLDGVLMVDHLSRIKRRYVDKKLKRPKKKR